METLQHKGLFNPGGCLTGNTFQRYLEGSLRPAEKARVEEHLRHCLICSDALEGFKRHRSHLVMQGDIEMLSGKIRKRYSVSPLAKKGLPVSILITLFVFLILLLVVYFIIRLLIANPT